MDTSTDETYSGLLTNRMLWEQVLHHPSQLFLEIALPGLSFHKESETVSHLRNGSSAHAWGFPGKQSENKMMKL